MNNSPKEDVKLDRYQIDAVARAILSGERKLTPALNRLADQTASFMTQFLQAQGVPGRFRVQGVQGPDSFRKEEVFKQIFSRVRKLVPIYEEKAPPFFP